MEETKTLQEQLNEFSKKRLEIEKEMESLIEFLTQEGFPGLKGGLVDAEGFPHPHLPITEIRTARNKLSCLKSDYKEINEVIEKHLFKIMEINKNNSESFSSKINATDISNILKSENQTFTQSSKNFSSTSSTLSSPIAEPFNSISLPSDIQPFAIVDEVFENSPANEAGLRVGDKILKIGLLSVDISKSMTVDYIFQNLPNEISSNENSSIDIHILRDGKVFYGSITPHSWSGVGLLGCHLVAYKNHNQKVIK